MRILLAAYMVSPHRGSEYSVAWNFITEMSKEHKITVLYGASGDHLGSKDELETFLKFNSVPNVEFIFIEPSWQSKCLNYPNRKGWMKYSFYLAYKRWHRDMYYHVINNLVLSDFDVVHYLNPIGYREPGFLYLLPLPYVWGPIGGACLIERPLLKQLDRVSFFKLSIKNMINFLQFRFSSRLKIALKNTNVLLTATKDNKYLFESVHKKNSYYLPENAPFIIKDENIYSNNDDFINDLSEDLTIKLVWVGRIDAAKNLSLFLDILSNLPPEVIWTADIVGDGELKKNLEKKYAALSNFVKWHGSVSREIAINIMAQSDLHIMTSISESNSTILFEAMGLGVPTISIKTSGMKDIINDETGVLINSSVRDLMIEDFVKAITKLFLERNIIDSMKIATHNKLNSLTWPFRVKMFNKCYSEAIKIKREEDLI